MINGYDRGIHGKVRQEFAGPFRGDRGIFGKKVRNPESKGYFFPSRLTRRELENIIILVFSEKRRGGIYPGLLLMSVWFWILITLVSVVILVFFLAFILSLLIFLLIFRRRYEENPDLRYFRAEDFDGITTEEVSFPSDRGQILHGYLYESKDAGGKGLVVFSHGIGAGHSSYTTEIVSLARHGYTVLGYDGTGCVESEGNCIRGMDQGPLDLKAALCFVAAQSRFSGQKCILVGHSWGAFSVMNSLEEENVSGAVAMNGFVSPAGIMAESVTVRAGIPWWLLKPFFFLYEKLSFGRNANRNSLSSLEKTEKPVLLLMGEKDKTVPYKYNGRKLRVLAGTKKNITTLIYSDKEHNVYLTRDAEMYMNTTFENLPKKVRKDKSRKAELYAAVDYVRMTAEDSAVMEEIYHFCDRIGEKKS